METITGKLVRNVDGNVDIEKSVELYRADVQQYIAARETEATTIGAAVHEVFDQYKGTAINMPALCTFVLAKLNAQPSNYKILSDRVVNFIRDNSQGKDTSEKNATENIWERPNSVFVINKGFGGGVYRRADHVAKSKDAKDSK